MLSELPLPFPEGVKIAIGALLALAVFTGIGLGVTMAVASGLLQHRTETALGRLRDFGVVEFRRDRLKWTLDEAALRRLFFRPGFTVLPLLAGGCFSWSRMSRKRRVWPFRPWRALW